MRFPDPLPWLLLLCIGGFAGCAEAPQKTFDTNEGTDASSSADVAEEEDTLAPPEDLVTPAIQPDIPSPEPDVVEDIAEDAVEEDVCAPQCDGLACGSDGCGGTCGECPEGQACEEGSCFLVCEEALEACEEVGATRCTEGPHTIETCEDTGGCLYWTPSFCPQETLCEEGSCVPICVPTCTPEAVCGDDGCGGTCGECPEGTTCGDGQCLEDQDGDGYPIGVDCNETNPDQNPGTPEVPYDGKDNDCDPGTPDDDADVDGYIAVGMGGDDCDDSDPAIHPAADDQVGDGIDQNCDSKDGVDSDGDGNASIASGGDDCDDTNPHIHPGVTDIVDNGVDENCDGVDGYAPAPEPDGILCLIAGDEGASISCPLHLLRDELSAPPAVALQLNLLWNPSLLALSAVQHVPCPGTWDCSPLPLLGAGAGVLPSGHALSAFPDALPSPPEQGHVSVLLVHPSAPTTPLTEAHLLGGEPSGESELFWVEFMLLETLDEETPAAVMIDQPLGAGATMVELTTVANEGFVITSEPQ